MGEALDALAARAVYTAVLFERAVHDPGPWTVTWGPHTAEAEREITDEGVVFTATFPETCYLQPPEPNAVLRCDGHVMAIRPIQFPGDVAFAITWAIRAKVLAHDVHGD